MSKHQVYTEEEIINALKSGVAEHDTDSTLYDSDENCDHITKASPGGGIECMEDGSAINIKAWVIKYVLQ